MEVYFIRHGETGGNVAHRHQAENTPLDFHGWEQAQIVAEEIKQLKPTHLITSTLVRAVETARAIGEACDLIPETNANFIELKRPTRLYGTYHKSVQSLTFFAEWLFGHKEDGESYEEIRQRFKAAESNLAQLPNDSRVVVVSHSVFINLFVGHICHEQALRPWEALKVLHNILHMPNTKVVKLTFDAKASKKVCAWTIHQ